jgi:HEAT repeat protein
MRFSGLLLTLTWLGATLCGCGPAEDPRLVALIREFLEEDMSWRQAETAERIAELGDPRALDALEPWLRHADRRIRGNAAYVFAVLHDTRGLRALVAILNDYSEERTVRLDGPISILYTEGSAEEALERHRASPQALRRTIKSDRYYAVHLLGKLGDPAAVESLIPFLNDDDINYKVAWALGLIGDDRATDPLIEGLSHPNADVRVSMILALQRLGAREALSFLESLIDDPGRPSPGYEVATVGRAASLAIESIRRGP